MMPCLSTIKGCEVVFPDTIFLSKGKPQMRMRSSTLSSEMDTPCLEIVPQNKEMSLE